MGEWEAIKRSRFFLASVPEAFSTYLVRQTIMRVRNHQG
jgi:hypothetical protein